MCQPRGHEPRVGAPLEVVPSLRWIDSPRKLSDLLRTPVDHLEAICEDISDFYKPLEIAKADGSLRQLRVPTGRLRTIQVRVLRRVLRTLAPNQVSACVRGRGVIWMMQRHTSHPWVISHDIRRFFPSVKPPRVRKCLTDPRGLGMESGAARLLVGLTTLPDKGLPQGACTSVDLADIVLRRFDRRLEGLAKQRGLTYSRYVDDFVLSGGSRVKTLGKYIERIADEEGWDLHDEKRRVMGPDESHVVLGGVTNQKPNVSATYFRDLRYHVGLIARGVVTPTAEELRSVLGRVAWVKALNPGRGQRLERALADSRAMLTS